MFKAFERIFKDNYGYRKYEKIPYVDSLAYTVQEILYTDKVEGSGYNFRLDGRIYLYDFMTLSCFFVFPSFSDFGKSTIRENIRELKKRKTPYQNSWDDVEYTKEGALLVTHASSELIQDLLWTAYIYARVRYLINSNAKWDDAAVMLKSLMAEELPYTFSIPHPLLEISEEACQLMIEDIRKHPRQTETQTNPSEESAEANDDNSGTLIKQKNELQAENERLRNEIEQLKQAVPSSDNNIEELKNEIERLKKGNEDVLTELLAPAFYGIEEDARKFLRKIKGLDNQGVTDVVSEWVKDRKIMPSKKGRFIWQILHAAKLYGATEQNWTAALRKNQ